MEVVVLQSYANYVEAHIAKGVLEERGIACWLNDENTVTIDPILTNAVGGIKLMVEKDTAPEAWKILQDLKKENSPACPNCGSKNTELVSTPRKASNWISAITTFFLSSSAIAPDKVNHCFDCGHEYPENESTETD